VAKGLDNLDRIGMQHIIRTVVRRIEIDDTRIAWLSRFRRLARDFERYARTVAAFIHLAMIRIMVKRLVASSSS
jgi:transposase